MSTVLQFEPEEYLEIRDMNREQLLILQTELKEELAELDAKEPKNMNSKAFLSWAEAHEDLEDALDEIQERLEELDG